MRMVALAGVSDVSIPSRSPSHRYRGDRQNSPVRCAHPRDRDPPATVPHWRNRVGNTHHRNARYQPGRTNLKQPPSRSLGGQQHELRKIRAIAVCVPGQEAHSCHGRVRANVEIRQGAATRASASTVNLEAFSRQERGLPRQWRSPEQTWRKGLLHLLDSLVRDGDFRVDQRIDVEMPFVRTSFEGHLRPTGPAWIIRRQIDENVRVDQGIGHLRYPRVSAMIWSVVMRTVALPRNADSATLARLGDFAFLRRTVFPDTSKSTSVLGRNPKRSRISWGIVTCPFVVIRIR